MENAKILEKLEKKEDSIENQFTDLDLIKPFYFTINEHDNGQPETLIYVLK